MNEAYGVYVKTDDAGYIVSVNSSEFLTDITGWTKIDEGTGDRFHHAQRNYFPKSIRTEGGAYRYRLVDGAPVECTDEEIAAQEASLAPETDNSGYVTWAELEKALKEGVNSV